jgi:inner membrane protein
MGTARMMAGSHVVVGIAAWTWAAPHLGLPVLDSTALAMAVTGSLLPDIDHPQSWLGRRLPIVSAPLARLLGHRGVTHSLLAVALCVGVLRWEGMRRGLLDPLAVGYLSHLAADLVTSSGLRLAWPWRARAALALCRTGSVCESVIVVVLIAWIGATMLHRHN